VADQVLGPSYTLDVARIVWRVVASGHTGLCHVTSAGATSWHDFAREIFRLEGLMPSLTAGHLPRNTARAPGARSTRPSPTMPSARSGSPSRRRGSPRWVAYLAERRAVSA